MVVMAMAMVRQRGTLCSARLAERACHAPKRQDETVTYTYDANGRLLQEQDVKVVDSCSTVTTSTVYQYGSNNSRTEQTAKTTYDDSNNVVRQETWAYDLAGRMVEDAVSTDGGETSVTTNFAYDDDGNRVAKAIDGGEQTAYLVDINNLTGYPFACAQFISICSASVWPNAVNCLPEMRSYPRASASSRTARLVLLLLTAYTLLPSKIPVATVVPLRICGSGNCRHIRSASARNCRSITSSIDLAATRACRAPIDVLSCG